MAEKLKIQVKRGAKATLPSLSAGELALTTDSDAEQLYIGTAGGNRVIGRVLSGTSLPVFSASLHPLGVFFLLNAAINTGDEDKLYISDGASWILCGVNQLADLAGSLDDIADGTTYGKVKNTELDVGRVKQILAANTTGQPTVSGDDIYDHVNSTANPHTTTLEQARTAGSSISGDINFNNNTGINVKDPVADQDIANKRWVLDQVVNLSVGMEWLNSVITRAADPTETGVTTNNGDRYLITTGTGDWLTKDNNIAEWDSTLTGGGGWVFTAPTTGMFVSTDDETNGVYYYGGASWSKKEWENTTAGTGTTKTGTAINVDFDNSGTGDATTNVLTDNTQIPSSGNSTKVARADHVHVINDIDCGTF